MEINGISNDREVTINTGNILSLDDITKKSGLNTTEEVSGDPKDLDPHNYLCES